MVGRGWWLLVLTVCVFWMVCCVFGGSFCQQGQEFYDSRDGQCVPCTRCQDPLVVVVPCYVFRDAICAPAIDFLPNLSQHVGSSQAPITLSTTPTSSSTQNISGGMLLPRHLESQISSFADETPPFLSEAQETLGHWHKKDKSPFTNKSVGNISNSGSLPRSDTVHFEKHSHKKHRHRHKHHGIDHSSVFHKLHGNNRSDNVSHAHGANDSSMIVISDSSDRNSRLFGVSISEGANSDKDAASSDLQEEEEPKASHWQNVFFFMTVVVISVCVIVLICIILSQLRNIFVRRKLKQRRVLGPSTSVDTNLYIESWQQADSQLPSQRTLSTSSVLATHTLPPLESISACPSPVPLRTYRLHPSSSSASPVVGARGLGSCLVIRDPMTPMSMWNPPPSESGEVVFVSRT